MTAQPLPAGFSRIELPAGGMVVARTGLPTGLLDLMRRPAADLAALSGSTPVAGGRAGPFHREVAGADRRVFVRPYARGGLLARWHGPGFPSAGRALRELGVSARAEALGLPVVPLEGVAAIARPDGRFGLSAWSWWDPAAPALPAAAGSGAGPLDALLDAAARSIAACQRAGLRHPDLNARNLVATGPGPARSVRLVDLDRAQFGDPLDLGARLAQLRRLYRSLVKEHVFTPLRPRPEFASVIRICAPDLPEGGIPAFLQSCHRRAVLHAIGWRLAGWRAA